MTREQEPPEENNAVLRMMKIIQAVDRWAADFEKRCVYQSQIGPLLPKVNIGAIHGGAPFRPNYFPGVCSLYVDVRTPPMLRPVQVQRELKQALNQTGVQYDMEMYASLMGYEAKGVEPIVDVVKHAFKSVCGQEPPAPNPFRASIWTDTNVYNEMGIPALKFGLGGKKYAIRSEQIDIEEIYIGAQVYALAAAEICNWER
jgi:acetylornithine deacetylase/succinyl-diaminopimelate desuccinylase-like protein